jgi:hypothetical protein
MDANPEPEPIPPPRDRDVLVAVLRLVGALAERLTGERVVVRIENERGDFVWCRPMTEYIRWEATVPEELPASQTGPEPSTDRPS